MQILHFFHEKKNKQGKVFNVDCYLNKFQIFADTN